MKYKVSLFVGHDSISLIDTINIEHDNITNWIEEKQQEIKQNMREGLYSSFGLTLFNALMFPIIRIKVCEMPEETQKELLLE